MASPTAAPTPPTPAPAPSAQPDTPLPTPPNPIVHYTAWSIAILGPIALLLPTRGGATKTTLQNAVLGASSFWGVNTLAEIHTGKSITARSGERWGAMFGFTPSDGTKKEEKEGDYDGLPTERAARNRMLMEAERRRRAEAEGREYKEKDRRGLWERIWMGGEQEGWKERRMEEERKALEDGRGIGGLIVEQVKEVWKGEGEGEGKGGKKED